MPKITRYGGMSNAGLTEKDGGFVDETAGTVKKAKAKAKEPTVTDGDPDLSTYQLDNPGEAPFNPSSMSVADVLALQADCTEDEWAAVVEAERADKNRAGIVGK